MIVVSKVLDKPKRPIIYVNGENPKPKKVIHICGDISMVHLWVFPWKFVNI